MTIHNNCKKIPLNLSDKIQIFLDYLIPLLFIVISTVLLIFNKIPQWYIYLFLTGFSLGAPFEFIQPRIGWVYYYKCITYKIAPTKIMWIIHAIWDSLILFLILLTSFYIWGAKLFTQYNHKAGFFMATMGMIIEIFFESHQTIWYYKPNKFNPVWAIINGRQMTLQQWHWAFLPVIYYIIIINLIYPPF